MTELQEKIIERLKAGWRGSDIARDLGCSNVTVSYVKNGRRGTYLTTEKRALLEKLWFEGELGAIELAKLARLSIPKTVSFIQKLEREEAARCRA